MILPVILHLAAFTQSKPVTPAIIGQIKAGVSEAALKTQTITSDFVQEKNMSMIREKIVTKGKFYFKKERMLRWEYLQPFSYIIVIRNDQVSIRDENKVSQFNVQSNKVFQEINRVILGCVRGTLL
ncbi:MAG: outer membrane lipoprotein carrier protein LolA, partial [Bacteroidota bacterium]